MTILFSLFIIGTITVHAETGAYSLLERSNWRRYNNGRYMGLVSREVRASVFPQAVSGSSSPSALVYQGNFYLMQSMIREVRLSAQEVEAVVPVSFVVEEDGSMIIENDQGFPAMRGFPAFPEEPLRTGLRWQAPGSRAADPLTAGHPLIIPFIAEYEYRGMEMYRDMRVHRISAVYASRYHNECPIENGLSSIQGTHTVDILVRVEDRLPVFMRDNLDVTYTMTDGSTVRFTGFTLTFRHGIVFMNRGQVIGSFSEAGFEDSAIDIVPVLEGIRLSIRDIRFVPDSAEFLPEEHHRLDHIAEALRQIPERTFLIEGHTAAVGRPESEMHLSVERARRMADAMVSRGINADRFIYKGWGGTRPLDDNATDAGRSRNRRVEITILE